MISGAQIRGARAILGISANELAQAADISLRTVRRFESVDSIPDGQTRLLDRIKTCLEARGIVFLGDPANSPGVQLQHPGPEELRDP